MFRASAHHVIPCRPGPDPRSVWQVYAQRWSPCYQGFHYQIITAKYVYLQPLSLLCFQDKIIWNAGPTNYFSSFILQYKGKRTEFRLTLQNVFIFLFLGNGAQKSFPWIRRYFQLKTIRSSQCTLAWYEDSIKFNEYVKFTYVWNTKWHEPTRLTRSDQC